jgi:hypothetical protein
MAQSSDSSTKKTTTTAKSNSAWANRYQAQADAYKKASANPTILGPSRAQAADSARYREQAIQAILMPKSIYWTEHGTPVLTNDRDVSASGYKAVYHIPDKSMRPIPLIENGSGLPGASVSNDAGSSGSWYYPNGGGGSGSGSGSSGGTSETTEVPITWEEFNSGVQGAPAFWKAMKPSTMNDATEYLASLNMMIPFLSPEDQKTVASNLYTQDAANFGHLNPEAIQFLPTTDDVTTRTKQMFTDSVRAKQAIAAMAALAGAVGKKDTELGSGYRYLRSILNLGNQFGGDSSVGNGQTRRQYLNMMSALDPLMAQSQTQQLAPYESVVKMLTSPFFSGGQLRPMSKDATGKVIFGNPNKKLL